MAIDIRASVTCSLGTLISASLSDDYVQGTGLIKCKGSCEISGIVTPAFGTVVTFSYTQAGVTTAIPRKLRVLSSFADPYRRTTKVELGCKLSYLQNLAPAPEVDGEPAIVTGKQQQCLNGYVDYGANSLYPIPISANGVMTQCLSKLGITASQNPLTNKFFIDYFDFSPGYVQVLGDLLVSESYCGYLDYDEVLQVLSLDQEGGTGPVIDSSKIIDLNTIGVGDLPGDAVVVFYDSVALDQDLDGEDPLDIIVQKRDYEYEESIGDLQYHRFEIQSDSSLISRVYAHRPVTITRTYYGQDLSWDDTLCYISGVEGPDLSDKPIRIVQTQSVIAAEAAANYCAQILGQGLESQFDPGIIDDITTTTYYTYNNAGDVTQIVQETYVPYWAWLGGLNVDFVFPDGTIALPSGYVLITKEITEIEYTYAQLPPLILLKPGENFDRLLSGQRVKKTVYENFTRTLSGQQGVAIIRDLYPWATRQDALNWMADNSETLVLTSQTLTSSSNRIAVGYQLRPPKALRLANSAGSRQRQVQKLVYSVGSPTDERTTVFTMPYQTDDYYDSTGKLVIGDAEQKARLFGRVQNRLLLGNRSGMNLQVAAKQLPGAPFAPFVVQANGLSALYRTNGTSWTMDANGVVVSTDALFWGAVGGTGTFWFPVAPGITTLPTTPAVVNGEMTVNAVVPVWNETVLAEARTRVGLTVESLPYALELLETPDPVTAYVGLTVQKLTPIKPPAAVVAVAAVAPAVSSGASVAVPATAYAVAAYAPAVASGASVSVGATTVALQALDPYSAGVIRTNVFIPAVDLAVTALTPAVSSGASVAVPNAVLTLAAAAPTQTGPDKDPSFSSVSLLLHMDGSNGSTTFTDSSSNAMTVTANGNAQVSTAQSKFGGASAYFDGTGDFLVVSETAAIEPGSSDLTWEMWIKTSNSTRYATLYSRSPASFASGMWSLMINYTSTTSGNLALFIGNYSTSAPLITTSGVSVRDDAWHHIAVVRNGSAWTIYIDGTSRGTGTWSGTIADISGNVYVGRDQFYTRDYTGYIDELRITKGVARYTATFTPSTTAFPNQ